MLNLCESFAYSYGLKFNANKTQLIRFGLSLSNTCNARIVFCGEQLVFLNTVCHLGHHLSYNLSDEEDINRKCHDFLKKANILFVNFKFCSPSTLTFLFRSICLSLYGCALWCLYSKSISTIEIAFSKVLRRIWNLPANSHTRIVLLVLLACLILSSPAHFRYCDLPWPAPHFQPHTSFVPALV